jgi:hypothetical protein
MKNKSGNGGFLIGFVAMIFGFALLGLLGWGGYHLLQQDTDATGGTAAVPEQKSDAPEASLEAIMLPAPDPVCDYINRAIADNVVLPNGVDFRKLRGTVWEAPVKYPALTPKEVRALAAAAVEAEILAKFSEEYQQKFRADAQKEAEELYRLRKDGEEIAFSTRNSEAPNAAVSGKLRGVTGDRVKIGMRWVLRIDIPDEVQAIIWQDAHQKAVREYCKRREQALQADLKFARLDAEKKIYPDIFRQNGYVPDIFNAASNRDKVVDEHWISAKELYDKIKRIGI